MGVTSTSHPSSSNPVDVRIPFATSAPLNRSEAEPLVGLRALLTQLLVLRSANEAEHLLPLPLGMNLDVAARADAKLGASRRRDRRQRPKVLHDMPLHHQQLRQPPLAVRLDDERRRRTASCEDTLKELLAVPRTAEAVPSLSKTRVKPVPDVGPCTRTKPEPTCKTCARRGRPLEAGLAGETLWYRGLPCQSVRMWELPR